VILDDATARRIAEAEGRQVIGLLGLLVHAKNRGLLSPVRPTLDRIVSVRFYLDDRLYRTVLRAAGEES
jgi:predicted nucleic acid-binding protein